MKRLLLTVRKLLINKTPLIIAILCCFAHFAIAQTTTCFSISGEAEEAVNNGNVNLSSSDLELGADTEFGTPGLQITGLRYAGFSLPMNATITNADIQFVADETSSATCDLTIAGESTGDALPYSTTNSNISNRSQTTAFINWQVQPWATSASGNAQKTPDISNIINEIIAHTDYNNDNAISFIISGTGTRTAENSPINLCVTYFVCGDEATACDDGMICTLNDVWDDDCNCVGTPDTDTDNDGVCDAEDNCPGWDNALIGTPCDDGDPETLNDAWQTDCTCQGGGEVIINEFSAANLDTNTDNYGEYEDWIELYNNNSVPFDLSGYHLSDNTNNPTKWAFPAGTTIGANDHLLIWCSNRDEVVGNNIHAGFKITQTKAGEEVVFADPMGNILDSNNMDIPNQRGHSWGRTIDGGNEWGILLNPTPNNTNTNVKLPYASKPVLTPEAGFYTGSVEVIIESPDENVTIYYTTDGYPPSASSTMYTGPFTLTSTSVVKAIAISDNDDIPPSFVDFHTYFVNDNHTVKVISIAGDEVDDLLNGAGFGGYPGSEAVNFPGSLELFDDDGDRVADATGEMNKHGNDSWAYDQRGIDFIARDQFGDDHAVKNEIFDMFNTTNRDKFQRLILKAGSNDNYSFEEGGAHIRDAYVHTLCQLADMELDERSYEPCVLYVNGDYWGMYEIREKVDDNDFTKYYYDQGRSDIQFIKTWGATWAEYGGNDALNDWNQLHSFILNNDMTDPSNYELVEKQLNIQSLVDYIIINTHVVSKDWLNWNTAWWRGLDMEANPDAFKWRYAMWDLDATFGHYINYTGVPDESPTADPCDNESPEIDDPQGHTEMLSALLENETFHALYINRYADLNNTYFTCDYMIDLLDQMIDRIAPEMPRQISRWGGSMNGWMNNVQELKDFINTRCTIINDGIEDCYEVEGPYNLTVIVEPSGAGDVQVNTLIPLSYPYQAEYFAGVPLSLEALPEGFNTFINWEPLNSALTPNNTDANVSFEMTELGDTIIAYFEVFECPPISITPANIMPAGCAGGGSASVIVMGGAGGPYEYQWDENANEQSSLTAEDLPAGDYTITATDVAGCEEMLTVTVPATDGALAVEIVTSDALCGSPNGAAEITPTSGTAPFTYEWSNATIPAVPNPSLPSGDYSVTITDAMDCETIQNITIGSTSNLEIDVEENDLMCFGTNDGMASVTTPGDFTYEWSNNSTDASISNLTAGTYTVTVTQNGCETVETVVINQPDAMEVDLNINESACSSSGSSATALGSGGTVPYTYLWTTGDNTPTIGGLDNGTYSVTVVDVNGCTAFQSFTINAESNAPSLITSQSNISCNGDTDGSIDLSINNGMPPFNYSWNNGETSEDLNNLPPGNYTVVVTDSNDCIAVTTVTISEPNAMTLIPESMPSSGNNGWAAINVNGGTPPYTYQWSDGQNTQIATGLAPGNYTVMVTDANNCTTSDSVLVDQFTNIINLEYLANFDIYPNPSDGEFVIDVKFDITQEADISIFSTLGQRIWQSTDKQSHFLKPVNIRDAAAGTYFVRVQTEKGQAVRQIVLK